MTAEQLRNSILQEAISGRLVPQDPNDEPASVLLERMQNDKRKVIPIQDEEMPYEIPGSWEWVNLGSIVSIITGKKDANFGSEDGTYDFFTCSNTPIKCKSYSYDGDYLIMPGNGANIGKVIHYKGKFEAYQRTYLLQGYGNFDLDYLKYHLMCNWKEYNQDKLYGSAIPYIKLGNLMSYPVALPPLAEQKRIVAKLEELLPIVEQYGKAQKELDELNAALPARLRQSILQEAISGRLVPQDPNEDAEDVKATEIEDEPFEIPNNWRWCLLGDLIDMVSGTSYKKDDVRTKGVRILRGGNIVNDELVLAEDDVFLPDEYANLEKNIRKDDIIIVASTGSQKVIGKPALIRQNYDKTQIGAFLRIIRAKDVKYVPFLWLIFKGMYYREHIRNLVKGTNINNIKEEYITTLPIPLPPLAEQKRIVAKLEELFAEIDKLK